MRFVFWDAARTRNADCSMAAPSLIEMGNPAGKIILRIPQSLGSACTDPAESGTASAGPKHLLALYPWGCKKRVLCCA